MQHMRSRLRRLFAAFLCTIALGVTTPADTRAQSRNTLDVLVVRIDDAPVRDAEVLLQIGRTTRTARTDSLGHARFTGVPAGLSQVDVRQFGYQGITAQAQLFDGDNRYTIELTRSAVGAQLLAAVDVKANPASARHAEYDIRVRRGEPSAVITRAAIEHRNPVRLSHMLVGIAGVRVADSLGSKVLISTRGMKSVPGGSTIQMVPCVMRIAIDGVIMTALTDVDILPPVEVHGVEVYYGPARVPQQYGGLRTDSYCGMVLIWTR